MIYSCTYCILTLKFVGRTEPAIWIASGAVHFIRRIFTVLVSITDKNSIHTVSACTLKLSCQATSVLCKYTHSIHTVTHWNCPARQILYYKNSRVFGWYFITLFFPSRQQFFYCWSHSFVWYSVFEKILCMKRWCGWQCKHFSPFWEISVLC